MLNPRKTNVAAICAVILVAISITIVSAPVSYVGNYTKFGFVDKTTGAPASVVVVGEKAPGGASDTIAAADVAAQIGNLAFITKTATYPTTAEIPGLAKVTGVTITTTIRYDITKSIALLDSEVTTAIKTTYNLILVGGPVANAIVKDLVDKKLSKVDWTKGEGTVEYIINPWGTGKDVLIVAGPTRKETRAAAADLITKL